MRATLQEVAAKAGAARDMESFWSMVHAELTSRGAASLLYGVLGFKREVAVHKLTKSVIWKGTHKREFFNVFGSETFLDDDMTARHCVESRDVLIWHDDRNWAKATPAELRRARISTDLGFEVGFTIPSSHFGPGRIGGIGVSFPDIPAKEFPRFWRQEGRELISICGLLDMGMREEHISSLVRLSGRETECLTWLAAGLRPDQIAHRLNIGGKSVEKYIAGARRKLRAATRDHAVAKAMALRLIEP